MVDLNDLDDFDDDDESSDPEDDYAKRFAAIDDQ